MKISIYNQEEIRNNETLVNFMLDTIIHNLSYLYGPYMDSKDNRDIWKENNLNNKEENNKFLIAIDEDRPLGFIIYSVNADKVMVIKEIEISKAYPTPPLILYSLLKELCKKEYDTFDCAQGYINKRNEIATKNFMRLASYKIEREKGYYIIIDREQTRLLKEKIAK